MPLRIRRLAAKIYHLGGVHSGAALAASVWFGLVNVAIFSLDRTKPGGGTIMALKILTAILDVLLFSILIMALPYIRVRAHDHFEFTQ
jgi:hypothetical protein